jgi:hypothetical protein
MTSQTNKQTSESDLAQRFLNDVGLQPISLSISDRPDIRFSINGRSIGMEVTVYHADEGSSQQANNESLRQIGERNARNAPGSPYTMAIPTDPHNALAARINDKISKAAQYKLDQTDELWLLVSAQQPSLGALPATYVVPFSIDTNRLDRDLHGNLNSSYFSRVYLHLNMNHAIYGWNRECRWHVVRNANPPDTYGVDALNRLR